jgi:hypothetical protein
MEAPVLSLTVPSMEAVVSWAEAMGSRVNVSSNRLSIAVKPQRSFWMDLISFGLS